MTVITNRFLTQEALTFLRYIVDHDGKALPPERQLAAALGIGKTTINGLRKSLAEQGLITFDKYDGAHISQAGKRELDAQEAANAVRAGAAAFMQKPIALDRIKPNPRNPRKYFDADALAELAASIREYGLRQPIELRDLGQGAFEISTGERRWRALCLNRDLYNGPADLAPDHYQIKPGEGEARDRAIALIENMQRENLSPMEEARAFDELANLGWSNTDIADRIKKTVRFVQDRRALTAQLAPEIVTALEQGQITISHAREIARADHATQLECLEIIHDMPTGDDLAAFIRTRVDVTSTQTRDQQDMDLSMPDHTAPEETEEDDGEEIIDDDPEQTNDQPAEPPC